MQLGEMLMRLWWGFGLSVFISSIMADGGGLCVFVLSRLGLKLLFLFYAERVKMGLFFLC